MNTLAGEIIRPNRTNLVCRWQSRGGKYWVELWHDQFGYFYRTTVPTTAAVSWAK
jgi:hypothetical protein